MSGTTDNLQNEITGLKARKLELIDAEKNISLQQKTVDMQLAFKLGKFEGVVETEAQINMRIRAVLGLDPNSTLDVTAAIAKLVKERNEASQVRAST
jgi:hypothetical protein